MSIAKPNADTMGTSRDPSTARYRTSINEQVFDGNKAITVQPFTEVNSKLGNQFEVAFYNAAVSAGADSDLIITVGADPVVVKDVQTQFDVDLISSRLYRAPAFSGGTPLTVYNLNDRNSKPAGTVITAGATVTDPGTQIAPRIYSLGSEGQGNRRISSITQGVGVERVLDADTVYLFRLTNESSSASRLSGVATWYQGPLSVDTELIL